MTRWILFLGFVWCALPVAATSAGAPAHPVEVKFCPAGTARTYPLDSMRGANGFLLQNVAVINRSGKPVTLGSIEVTLQSGGRAVDSRRFGTDTLAKFAKGGQAVQASGMMKLAAFQFCGTDLLGNAPLSDNTTLAPGAALLIMHQPFAFQGARDRLVVTAYAGVDRLGEASLALTPDFAKTDLIFPLTGAWYAASGPSFHTQHRWAIPEEFGLDLVKLDANGKTHRGDGSKFSDYYGYGAPIVAPAAGKVVMAVATEGEDPKAMRQKGETQEAFFERVLNDQAARMTRGTAGIIGNGVMIDHGNGEFSLLAHMKPGSVKVVVGDTVTKGQVLGALGSSGNSTEPHLHYHLCDKPDPLLCAGIPLAFSNIDIPLTDLPRPIQSGDMIVTR